MRRYIWHIINYLNYLLMLFCRFLREVNPLCEKREIINSIPIKLSANQKQTFFGYYDITPFSFDNNKLLALAAPLENKPPGPDDEVLIGYFDCSKNYTFNLVGKSKTWCWQQGCRLQWFPEDENELIIYNTMFDGSYGSVIQNVSTQEIIRRYHSPIYDIDKKGHWAITLNFSRLHRLRSGYGYVNLPDTTASDLCPLNDGVWLLDLSNGVKKLIISLKELSEISPHDTMYGAAHYINHLKFNPSGSRFMFFHLWMKGQKRFSRLFTCDVDGNHLHLLANDGMVSHYCWKNDSELLVYSYHFDTGSCYHLYNDLTDEREIFAPDILNEDGHPSFHSKNKCLLTDTSYLDKYSERKVLLLNEEGHLHILGSFYSPFSYKNDIRCDLHPRWDREGRQICFDSAHEGHRNVYIIKMEEKY